MSLPGSPEVLYHAIPQSPNTSQIELAGETNSKGSPMIVVDTRIRWAYFILGCSVLLSWNVVITAMPYFLARLTSSSLRSSFSSYLTTSFTLANFIFLVHATLTSKQRIPSRQTHTCIALLTFLNFCLTASTFFVLPPGFFFAFVILNGALQASVGAYLQTSVIAVASLFGPLAVQAMVAGQAAVAVAVSGVQVVSAAFSSLGTSHLQTQSDGSAEERSAFVFFLLSTSFLVGSAIVHRWLVRTPTYQHVAATLEQQLKSSEGLRSRIRDEERRGLVSNEVHPKSAQESRVDALRVAKQNLIFEVAVALVFVVTLAVYPPITTSVQPTNPSIHPLLFTAFHFLIFNVGDFLGRYVCSFPRFLIWSGQRLLTISMMRILFIPLFFMCNVRHGNATEPSQPIIHSDVIFMLLLFLFGWSNGYISSLCLMAAASLNHNPRLKGRVEDVDIAATVASLCLVGGLMVGSFASFAVKGAICQCNPFTE